MFSKGSYVGAVLVIAPTTLVALVILLLGFLAITREPVMIGKPHDTTDTTVSERREYSSTARDDRVVRPEVETATRPKSPVSTFGASF